MTSLTTSHYPIVSPFHNKDNVPLAFPDKDVWEVFHDFSD